MELRRKQGSLADTKPQQFAESFASMTLWEQPDELTRDFHSLNCAVE